MWTGTPFPLQNIMVRNENSSRFCYFSLRKKKVTMFENPDLKPIWTILPIQIFRKSGDKKNPECILGCHETSLRISEHCDESSFRLFLPFQLHSRFEAKEEPLSLLSMMSYGSILSEILPFFLDEQNRFLFMKKLYCKLCITFMKFSIV